MTKVDMQALKVRITISSGASEFILFNFHQRFFADWFEAIWADSVCILIFHFKILIQYWLYHVFSGLKARDTVFFQFYKPLFMPVLSDI